MKKTSKVLAAVMAIVMIVAAIPMTVLAASDTIGLGETKTIHVPEEDMAACKFTPEKDGIYVVYSDMGENDIDPYVSVCDEDGNEIASDDDNDYYDTYDFYCIFEAEAGVDYWFEMIDLNGYEVTFDITVAVYGEIEHQPTDDEPYVEVTEGADAEYQWYKLGDSFVEVTDENADPREGEYDSGEYATYDSENGWTGVLYDDFGIYNEYNFFNVMLLEGNTIKMTADSYAGRFGIWCVCGDCDEYWENLDANDTVEITADHTCIYNTYGDYEEVPHLRAEMSEMTKVNKDAELESEEAGTYVCLVTFDGCRLEGSDEIMIIPEIELNETVTISLTNDYSVTYLFKPEKSGIYVIISDNGGNDDDIDPYVEVYDSEDEYIAEDDDNDYFDTYNFYCIFEATAGKTYYIYFDGYDYGYEYDAVIKTYGEITHQPTVTEPYVGVTEGADAKYQWFKVGDIIEVTDENTKELSYSGAIASYDPEKGWTGMPTGYTDSDYAEYDFFELELKEGQTIAMTFDCDMYDFDIECVGNCDTYEYYDWDDIKADETIYFTANHDCYFFCYGDSDTVPVMKAEIMDAKKIDGATDAEYDAKEIGEYFCRVTFDGTRTEKTDSFEVTECEHSYTDGKDAICDLCEYNRTENCDHICHKDGFFGFLWKIAVFFCKLFNINPICECEVAHY